MIRTTRDSVHQKYCLVEGVERRLQEGKIQLAVEDTEDISEIKKSMKSSTFYGLGAGLLISGMCLANYSYLRTLPIYIKGLYLGMGPVFMPLIFRMRAELQYQNYLLFLG